MVPAKCVERLRESVTVANSAVERTRTAIAVISVERKEGIVIAKICAKSASKYTVPVIFGIAYEIHNTTNGGENFLFFPFAF